MKKILTILLLVPVIYVSAENDQGINWGDLWNQASEAYKNYQQNSGATTGASSNSTNSSGLDWSELLKDYLKSGSGSESTKSTGTDWSSRLGLGSRSSELSEIKDLLKDVDLQLKALNQKIK